MQTPEEFFKNELIDNNTAEQMKVLCEQNVFFRKALSNFILDLPDNTVLSYVEFSHTLGSGKLRFEIVVYYPDEEKTLFAKFVQASPNRIKQEQYECAGEVMDMSKYERDMYITRLYMPPFKFSQSFLAHVFMVSQGTISKIVRANSAEIESKKDKKRLQKLQ